MGFCVGAYATVFDVQIREKSTKVSLSVSKKVKGSEPPKYDNEFRNYVLLIGEAHKKAAESIGLKDKDRIRILSCDVKTPEDEKNPGKYFTNYYLYDWEPANDRASNSGAKSETVAKPKVVDTAPEEDEDDLPF